MRPDEQQRLARDEGAEDHGLDRLHADDAELGKDGFGWGCGRRRDLGLRFLDALDS